MKISSIYHLHSPTNHSEIGLSSTNSTNELGHHPSLSLSLHWDSHLEMDDNTTLTSFLKLVIRYSSNITSNITIYHISNSSNITKNMIYGSPLISWSHYDMMEATLLRRHFQGGKFVMEKLANSLLYIKYCTHISCDDKLVHKYCYTNIL